jgi:hypothetical protein
VAQGVVVGVAAAVEAEGPESFQQAEVGQFGEAALGVVEAGEQSVGDLEAGEDAVVVGPAQQPSVAAGEVVLDA